MVNSVWDEVEEYKPPVKTNNTNTGNIWDEVEEYKPVNNNADNVDHSSDNEFDKLWDESNPDNNSFNNYLNNAKGFVDNGLDYLKHYSKYGAKKVINPIKNRVHNYVTDLKENWGNTNLPFAQEQPNVAENNFGEVEEIPGALQGYANVNNTLKGLKNKISGFTEEFNKNQLKAANDREYWVKRKLKNLGDKVLRYGAKAIDMGALYPDEVDSPFKPKQVQEVQNQMMKDFVSGKETPTEIKVAGTRKEAQLLKDIEQGRVTQPTEQDFKILNDKYQKIYADTNLAIETEAKRLQDKVNKGELNIDSANAQLNEFIKNKTNNLEKNRQDIINQRVNLINKSYDISNAIEADYNRKIQNADIISKVIAAGILLDTGGTATGLLPAVSSIGGVVAKKALQKTATTMLSNKVKKETLKYLAKEGYTKAEQEALYKLYANQIEHEYSKLLAKQAAEKTLKNAAKDVGIQAAAGSIAGATDMALFNAAVNEALKINDMSEQSTPEAMLEGAKTGGLFGLGMGVAGATIPKVVDAVEGLRFSPKQKVNNEINNEIVPYSDNPNIKYSYNNGNGFFMYDNGEMINPARAKEPEKTENFEKIAKNKTDFTLGEEGELKTPERPKAPKVKYLVSKEAEEIKDIAPNIAAKQANKDNFNIYNFKKGDVIKDKFTGAEYEVIEPDKRGMGFIKNIQTGVTEAWNAHNNPRFSKVEETSSNIKNEVKTENTIPEKNNINSEIAEIAPNITKKQMIQEKVNNAITTLSANKFVPESQKEAMLSNMKGEEKEHFADITNELQNKIDNAPEIYQTQTMNTEDIKPVLHYFAGSYDYYVTEIDKETGEMFGVGGLNGDYEYGYNTIESLNGLGDMLNVDLYPDKNLSVKDLLGKVENGKNVGYNDSNAVNEVNNYGHNESTVLQQSRVAEEKQGINGKSEKTAERKSEVSTSVSDVRRTNNSGLGSRGITEEHSELVNRNYKNQNELNKSVEDFINNKEYEKYSELPEEVKTWLNKYTGAGGLEKQGATGKGLLSEYYTPKNIVKKMWDLTSQYINTNGAKVLEPSVGIGRFLENAPENAKFDVVEMNPVSAKITELLYPNANVEVGQFQQRFIDKKLNKPVKNVTPEYDIVIGNPPYGEYSGMYKGLGEGKGIYKIEQYFIKRGLDSLKENGVMTFIVPSSFLDTDINEAKLNISKNAEILDAYRLPENTFDTTSIGTDIIVLRKNTNEHDRQSFVKGNWFKNHPEKVLGETLERKNKFGKQENYVKGDKNAVESIQTGKQEIKETVKSTPVTKKETKNTIQNKKTGKSIDDYVTEFDNDTVNGGFLDTNDNIIYNFENKDVDLPKAIKEYEANRLENDNHRFFLKNKNLAYNGEKVATLGELRQHSSYEVVNDFFKPEHDNIEIRMAEQDVLDRAAKKGKKVSAYIISGKKAIYITKDFKIADIIHEYTHILDDEINEGDLLYQIESLEYMALNLLGSKNFDKKYATIKREKFAKYNENVAKERILNNDKSIHFRSPTKRTPKVLGRNVKRSTKRRREYGKNTIFNVENAGESSKTSEERAGETVQGTAESSERIFDRRKLKQVNEKAKNYIRKWYSDIELGRYEVNKTLTSFINLTKQKARDLKVSDKQIREIMPFLRERTDFPEELNRPDLKKLWDKLSKEQKTELTKLADSVSEKFEKYYKEYQELKGNPTSEEIEHHISHIWDLDKKQKSLLTNYFSTKSRFAKERTIETLYKGIQGIEDENGDIIKFTPKTLDYAEILKTSSDTFIKSIADINLANVVKDLKIGKENLVKQYNKAPSDWVEINHPALNKSVYSGPANDIAVLNKMPVKVHPDIADTILTVFETPETKNEFLNSYDNLNSIQKQAQLGFSGFHMVALSESMLANMGIKETLKVLNPVKIWDEVVKGNWNIYKQDTIAKQAIEDGLQLGATLDLDRKNVEKIVDNVSDYLAKNIPFIGKAISYLPATLSKVQKANNIILWDYLHNNYKLECYKLLCQKEGQNKTLTDKDRQEIAQWVNDSFGGQVWENLGIKPSGRRIEQRVLLSPDWLRSTTRQFLSMLSSEKGSKFINQKAENSDFWKKAKELGERWGINSNTDNVTASGMRGRISRAFWLRALIYSAVIYNGLNAMFREDDRKKHPELYPKNMSPLDYSLLGNSKGYKTYVFIGRNSDGTERYLRLGKQFREVPELVTDPIKKLGGKASPNVQLTSQLTTGHTASGFKNKNFFENKYPYTRMKEGKDRLAASAKTIGQAFMPYSTNDLFNPDKEYSPLSLFAPVTKGMTKGKAKYLLESDFYNGKNKEEIVKSLRMNGYSKDDIDKIYKQARGNVRREYRDEYIEAINSGNKQNIINLNKKLIKKGLTKEEIELIYKKALKKTQESKE